jgi:serine/threonine-protein kinase
MSNQKPPQPPTSDQESTIIATPQAARQPEVERPTQKSYSLTNNLTIEGIIGQGGVGCVYLAYDENIGRRVAVKEILNYHDNVGSSSNVDDELINSFIHEAKITGKLEHPGIIPIYEIGHRDHHGPYYVMKYVKGSTLEESFKQCEQSAPENDFNQRIELLDILIDVCEALAYAHSKGVIHRDIKPSNIITGKFGETIILDWGLAQVLDDQDNTQFYRKAINHQRHTFSDSSSSDPVGTPRYMAPEQVNGTAGKASDVYSLGVILFRIICGQLPYQGSAEEVQKQLTNNAPSPSVRRINPSAPPELAAICKKAMAKKSRQRFNDAGELVKQLKAFRDGRMVNIYAYSKRELLHRFISRNKLMSAMVTALITVIISGAGFSLHYAVKMDQARSKAENSLATITAVAEISQKQARTIATAISSGANELFADLKQAADKISNLGKQTSLTEQQILSHLHHNYPRFEAFTIINADKISTGFSLGWKTISQHYDAPLAKLENGRLTLIFRVPIIKEGHIGNYLEAKMFPEKVIPALFPVTPESESQAKDIWIMRNDGLIIYDQNPQYTGTNLFTDQPSNQSPSLLAFGKLTLGDDDGIGYYSFIEAKDKIEKLAAWDTVQFGKEESWKIIVNYTYLVRKNSQPGKI